jgi:GNAT superfamily N-acetyltransferase
MPLLNSEIMESPHSINLETKPHPNDITAIVNGLAEFNRGQTGGAMPEYLLVTVRDAHGSVVGGLFGATYLGWLQVQCVWLPDALRGHRYGTELMVLVENEALRRGCKQVFLETYSFQALPFYEKCGYAIHSRMPDFPVGGARYALTKSLSGAASPLA